MAFKVLGGDLAKRLRGADSALAPRSLLAKSPQNQGVFWPDHTPIVNRYLILFQGHDLAKRLLSADSALALRSLLAR